MALNVGLKNKLFKGAKEMEEGFGSNIIKAEGGIFCGGIGAPNVQNSTFRTFSIIGINDWADNENDATITVPKDGILRNLFTNIPATRNGLNDELLIKLRVNLEDTIMITSYAAGTTGNRESEETITVSAGDRLSIRLDATAAGAGSVDRVTWGVSLN